MLADPETILNLPIDSIYVDYEWNRRSKAEVLADVTDGIQDTTRRGEHQGEGTGFQGLLESLRDDGQDIPVVVRAVENGRTMRGVPTECTYELVAGFRRMTALRTLNGQAYLAWAKEHGRTQVVPNTPNGTVRAVVRKLSPLEARKLNIRENTFRHGLTAPDTVGIIQELAATGLTVVQIGRHLGVSHNYVSKLFPISKLPAPVVAHWRGLGSLPGLDSNRLYPRLTVNQMLAIAGQQGSEAEIVQNYIIALSPQVSAGKIRKQHDQTATRVYEVATLLGQLVKRGVLLPGNLEWSRVIGPKSAGYLIDSGHSNISQLWELASDSFEKAKND